MSGTDDEKRFDVASLTLEMVARVERLLDGRATREQLCSWAHEVQKTHGRVFVHNAAADALHTCLWSLDETLANTDEPLVRRVDLVDHLRAVQSGEPKLDSEEIAVLTLTLHEIAVRTSAQATRIALDGIGWFEVVRFASPATGRCFVAGARLQHPPHPQSSVRTYRYPATEEERARVVSDLLDTLSIDMDEAVWSQCRPARRWRLMRADDNGNTALVAELTGYAKARAQLAAYEERAHKQTYWIDAG
jgi:hypothetical protein